MGKLMGVIYNEFNYLNGLTRYYLLRYHDQLRTKAQDSGKLVNYSRRKQVLFLEGLFRQTFREYFAKLGNPMDYDPARHFLLKEEVEKTVGFYSHELLLHLGHSEEFRKAANSRPLKERILDWLSEWSSGSSSYTGSAQRASTPIRVKSA